MRHIVLGIIVGAVLAGALAVPVHAATRFDPALRFRQRSTLHFTLYFPPQAAGPAERLAAIVEETWTSMQQAGWTVPTHTHVVLADQADLANGWATPLPYNTIVLLATWPSGAEYIGLSDDWLRLVFTHEFTHIVHLDRSRGWARAVKRVFGRVPVAFPNLSLPTWQIEGIATLFESELTGSGRAYANDFRAIEREPARQDTRVPIDRVNGGLVRWPGGTVVYSAGLGFHEFLARRYGRERLIMLADRTAGRLPFFGSTAFRPVFERSLGELWTAYQAELRAGTAGAAGVPPATRVTRESFDVSGVRFLAPRCDGCEQQLAYSVRNPHEFPALKVVTTGGAPRTLTTRYLGDVVGSTANRIVFDQRELARNVGLYSDLYLVDRTKASVTRLTEGLRLLDPDVSPDGRTIVATQQTSDRRRLVTLPLFDDGRAGPVTSLRDDPDVQYATPRWSPDGRAIAVERHLLGQTSEVVIVSADGQAVQVVARGATRAVTPAWRPDGQAIIAAVDTDEGPFNLVEFPIDGNRARARRLTSTTGGALWPDVSVDGRILAYVGYTAEGYDVFTQPYPTATPSPDDSATPVPDGPVERPVRRTPDPVPGGPGPAVEREAYSPWPTLLPRAWAPVVAADGEQTRVGISSGGTDVLGYHAWSAALWWRARAPGDAINASAVAPDWSAIYVYDRWQPQVFASAARQTSFLTGASAPDGDVATLREQTIEAGLVLPVRRVLRSRQWLLSLGRTDTSRESRAGVRTFSRVVARTGWSFRSSRTYGYSVSPEDGVAVGATAEVAGSGLSAIDDATTITADGRAYIGGPRRHHVLAVRLGGGLSTGPRDLGRTFRLGGAFPNASVLDFGRSAFSLLRGFAPDTFAGRRVVASSLEYRAPLLRVERGHGTWPLFIRQFHGSLVADAAHAWRDEFRLGAIKTSFGAELSADVVAGFSLPLTIAGGVARGHDGSGQVPATTTFYVRLGRSF